MWGPRAIAKLVKKTITMAYGTQITIVFLGFMFTTNLTSSGGPTSCTKSWFYQIYPDQDGMFGEPPLTYMSKNGWWGEPVQFFVQHINNCQPLGTVEFCMEFCMEPLNHTGIL